MFIVDNYALAVVCCVVTMLCWGSWSNTQKLSARSWRYELFYWDYVIGTVLFAVVLAFTFGSFGSSGRGFLEDIAQVEGRNILSAFTGGVIFNAANILLSASVALAGMAVAFPLGIGLALVVGVIINYIGAPKGDPMLLFLGVALIVVAVVCNGVASARKNASGKNPNYRKGVWLAVASGVLMSLFYRFVASAMDLESFHSPTAGLATPYTAFFIFTVGIFASNLVFNTYLMKRPFAGAPVTYKQYFSGNLSTHLVGVLGGCIWALGTSLNYIAAGPAGAAISYALGQGAPMIAALWGVFVWKEFAGASRQVRWLLGLMFALFVVGLSVIVLSGGN